MDIRDIENYKKEMLKLYSKGKTVEQPIADEEITEAETKLAEEFTAQKENTVPPEYQQNEIKEEIEKNGEDTKDEYDDKAYGEADHDTSYFPYTADEEEAELQRIINGADLSDTEQLNEQELSLPSELGDSTGFILVNVRAGNEATPIVGASVIITATDNGRRLLTAVGITDISGTIAKISVPAPDKAYSLTPYTEIRPYSLFDISVRAKGFYNARSVDVPVFSGITSVQSFNMIPLPIGAESDENTLTYLNSVGG